MPPKEVDNRALINRPERFTLSGLHNVHFIVKFSDGQTPKCRLLNLSSYGLAFEIIEEDLTILKDQKLQAEIVFDNQPMTLILNVRHLDAAVGCRIENSDQAFREQVENFFINEMAAVQLVKVDSPHKGTEVEGEINQYKGSNSSFALAYIEKNETITHLDLTMMGTTIKMDNKGNIEYGFLIEEQNCGPEDVVRIKVQHLPDEMINHALRFIWNVQAIPSNIKQTLMGMLEDLRHKKTA